MEKTSSLSTSHARFAAPKMRSINLSHECGAEAAKGE